MEVEMACQTRSWPNVRAVIREISAGDDQAAEVWMKYAMRCFEGAHAYFLDKFHEENGALAVVMKAAKSARIFWPNRANDLCPDADSLLAHVQNMPFLPLEFTQAMAIELPVYLAAGRDVDDDVDVLQCFSRVEKKLPSWHLAFRIIMAIEPSSAETERAFSMMRPHTHQQAGECLT